MDMNEIMQLIIEICSFIATIVVSIVLYKLDRKREQQINNLNEQTRLLNLEHEANIFIIKNGDEIEYLPLCILAHSINGTKKHKRAIYNNFNLCSDELKKIILAKSNLYLRELPKSDWFSSCNDKFKKTINQYKLGKDMYYDNAKYVTRCFTHYGKDNLPVFETSFTIPDYIIDNNNMEPRGTEKCGLRFYISRFLDYLSDINKYNNLHNIDFCPPCDSVYDIIKNSKENICCYWCAVQMRYLCSQFRELPLENNLHCNSYSDIAEIVPEYYEDLYYCALYELYITFGKQSEHN